MASGSKIGREVPSLRLLFFGTPEFAVPSLRSLIGGRHPVVGVVSQPDRPRGRGRTLAPTPVRALADANGIPVFQPEKVGSPDAVAWMRAREPDLGCVVAFGQFIPRSVRDLPPHGLINAHASLLPRHRGAAPVQHAILAGDAETGVTIIRVERGMDAGAWCLMRPTPIGPEETAGELAERLAALAGTLLLEAVEGIARGEARFRPQATEGVSLAPKVGKDLGRLRFDVPADEVLRRIRAATPWPGATVALRPSGLRLRILRARADAEGSPGGPPGRVIAREGRLWIAARDACLELLRVQVPGRRPLDAAEFLRGTRIGVREEATTA